MGGLISWWVRNAVAANLLMVFIIVSGLIAWTTIEKEVQPIVKLPLIQVSLTWPGASPKEIEQQVVQRVEAAVKNIDNLRRYNSDSREGFGSVRLEAQPRVDLTQFKEDVRDALDGITSFPRDLEPPRIRTIEWKETIHYLTIRGDIGERALGRLAEELRDELISLSHVSDVDIGGTREEEVTIEVSEEALQRYQLSFGELATAIRASSINLSSGELRTATGNIQLRAENLADSQTDFEAIIVRELPSGAQLRLGDVARVIDGFEDFEVSASADGVPAVMLQIEPSDRLFITKTSDQVNAWIDSKQAELPQGVELLSLADMADAYDSRMSLIFDAAWMGLILVMLILLLTLRFTVALWVTVGIAISFVGAFIFLPVVDVSINFLSTFAFLLVLGIVVDDAIVVGESIHHHREDLGLEAQEAAIVGASAVARPVIFAVLTTVVAFAPWAFLSGPQSEFLRHLSAVIAFALAFSLIEAFCILPAHLRHLPARNDDTRGFALQRRIADGIMSFAEKTYAPLLAKALNVRYTLSAIFLAGFVIALTLASTGWVRFYFFPQLESETLVVNVGLPTGVPFSRTEAVMNQLDRTSDGLKEQYPVIGAFTFAYDNQLEQYVQLPPPGESNISMREVAETYLDTMGDIPDAENINVQYTANQGEAVLTFVFAHTDEERLKQAAADLRNYLVSFEDVFFVRDNQRGEIDELNIRLKPGAQTLGVTLADVSRQVRQSYYGEEVQRLPRQYGDVRVMLRYPQDARETLTSLRDLNVRTNDGRLIPLATVADIEVRKASQRIVRRNGQRIFEVFARVNVDSMGDINEKVQDEFIPELQERFPALQVIKGGWEEQQAEFMTEVTRLFTIAMLTIYALLAVAFRSYTLPTIIMSAIPFAYMGAIFGHQLIGIPLDMFSFFGMGAAAGVVVNDNLVLIDYILKREEKGDDRFTAIINAAKNRFRPILLTTLTTFVGLMPIIAETSQAAAFLKPSVISLAFGVFFAFFVSLFLVPALYLIGDDWGKAKSRLSGFFPRFSKG
ncbi:MAG: RND transporter [Halieaceae bacterium]|nr:RND transporter [Halieaceae bacterium]RPG91558.1 MAG: efflux RND transporter permease subunit [Cellvibrionales bacterium TMED157]